MLSRTAENLFWMTRYMERAETAARLLEVGFRIALIPSTGKGNLSDWSSILISSGMRDSYLEKHDQIEQGKVEDFLFFDHDNPSSVANCIENARNNARTVRTAITSEVWDALNSAFQELKEMSADPNRCADILALCDWMKRQAAVLRGAIESTQLRHDGYDFMNLGYYLERANNTARLLDVKYYVLLPTTDRVGGSTDNYQWVTLLRSLSAFRAFHWAYGGDYSPRKIADFLILNKTNPRSLLHCTEEAAYHLNRLGRAYGTKTDAQMAARSLLGKLAESNVGDIVSDGLHEFLNEFISDNTALGQCVSDAYMFGAK